MRYLLFAILLYAQTSWGGEYYYINGGKKIDLVPILQEGVQSRSADGSTLLRFKEADGREIAIGKRLVVKFKETKNLDEYLDRYGLTVVKKYSFGPMYLLEAASPEAAMEAANALSRESGVAFAQPDLIRKRSLR